MDSELIQAQNKARQLVGVDARGLVAQMQYDRAYKVSKRYSDCDMDRLYVTIWLTINMKIQKIQLKIRNGKATAADNRNLTVLSSGLSLLMNKSWIDLEPVLKIFANDIPKLSIAYNDILKMWKRCSR